MADLEFDTDALRRYAQEYGTIANDLRTMADRLMRLLDNLKSVGWTTPAGEAFAEMVDMDWKENIEKYAQLLETLQDILESSASEYDNLVTHIENTKLP